MEPALLVAPVVLALAFAWTNGFHDTANAVATSLQAGALTPRVALGLAAVLNGIGCLIGVDIAIVVGRQLVDVPVTDPGAVLVLAAIAAAIGWNVLTWWFGLPSSSSHALIGALAGAGLAAGVRVDWAMMGTKVLIPMLASPVAGLVLAAALAAVLMRVLRRARYLTAVRGLRLAQTVSASAMALGHGLQDGQKAMGVIVLGLAASGVRTGDGVPLWVRFAVAVAIAAGTAAGGWRIIRTLARRVVPVDPLVGFSAETVAAAVLHTSAGILAVPVSSTHAVTAAVVGAGAARGLRRIRWLTVRRILLAWVLTPVATAGTAAGLYLLIVSPFR